MRHWHMVESCVCEHAQNDTSRGEQRHHMVNYIIKANRALNRSYMMPSWPFSSPRICHWHVTPLIQPTTLIHYLYSIL